MNIPADVPAANFWSLVAYDAETRSMIKNNLQPLPAVRSLDSNKLIQNEEEQTRDYPELSMYQFQLLK